ncbi:GGDEF domain-containing protein [Peribacillus glennii]|uniref:GGDEF domain-containing protein n=2 Tax=Peribacillus glennii TaxID=2303991 RepID=A0A372LII3_9BACI|nr:GGDEF domain-containing protein [Peribacillus glennii]
MIIPAGITLSFQHFPPLITGRGWDTLAFLVLMCILSFIPMIINNTPISSVQGVSLAVFLIFGLAVEMILTQISFMFMLLMLRLRRNEMYRLPLNSLIFFFVSVVSGMIYYGIGGTHDFDAVIGPSNFWKILIYLLVYFMLNTLFISVSRYILNGQKLELFTKDAVWDFIASLVVLPIGLILFILYDQLGYLSILFGGIPLVGIALVLKLYNSSQEVSERLKRAGEFGHELTQRLQVNEVLSIFVLKIPAIIPSDNAYILDLFNEKNEIHLLGYAEQGIEKKKEIPPLTLKEGISGFVWKSKKGVIFHKRREWEHLDIGILPETIESLLAVPIVRNELVVGVLILASGRKRAYEQYHLMITDILCSYLAVAIENARHLHETKQKSERCALTNLYNYRFFEDALENEFIKLQNREISTLSLILLDIDHFKTVNDTYGHQSGNDILAGLARRLERLMPAKGIVARYGGEEFVILLPDVSKSEAFDFAESIRHTIASKPFTVYSDLDDTRTILSVPITASIGLASAPLDAEDAQALIRHADRAMYTGAKQAGRNRVAKYVG